MTEEWVVVLEAASGAGDAVVEQRLVDRLLDEVADCKPGILYVPDRLALQLWLTAGSALDAHLNALARWRRAVRAVGAPPLTVLRLEILTAQELERDCLAIPVEEGAGHGPPPSPAEHELAETLLRGAFEDPDTGLPSAELFRGYVHEALRRQPRSGAAHAVLVLAVEVLHAATSPAPRPPAGRVLAEVARRLAGATRPADRSARVGDGTFAVLLESVLERDAVAVAERTLKAVSGPVAVDGGQALVQAGSIGIALSRPGANADRLMTQAAAAMCAAKAAGGGHCQLFRPGMPTPDPASVGLGAGPST